MNSMWHQMLVLKARQLGCTTFFAINFLDDCFWMQNISSGIIAHRKEDAEDIFKKKVKFAYDKCPNGQEVLIQQRMTELENFLSEMDQAIEYPPDFGLGHINGSLFPNSARYARNPRMLLARLLQVALIQSHQIKSLQLSLQQREEKDISTISASKLNLSQCEKQNCRQCKCDSFSSPGMTNQDMRIKLRDHSEQRNKRISRSRRIRATAED